MSGFFKGFCCVTVPVMCVCLGMTMFACGASKDDNTKETESGTSEATEPAYTEEDLVDDSNGDLNILDYVDLGDYKGIELTKSITKCILQVLVL